MDSVLDDLFDDLDLPLDASGPRGIRSKKLKVKIAELEKKLHDVQSTDEARQWLHELHQCTTKQMDYRAKDYFKLGFDLALQTAFEVCAEDEVFQKLLSKTKRTKAKP